MRYVPLLLSASVALFSIPAAAAVNDDASPDKIVVAAACPKMEGYPDCHPDDQSGWSTHSGRAFRTRT
jgi:hypothetical protein